MARCSKLRASRGEGVAGPNSSIFPRRSAVRDGLVSHDPPADFDVLSISYAQLARLNQAQLSDSSWCHFDLENSLANGGLE
jgi:hypothetical protein